jgi:selenocysteine-specific translation elongation factor
MTLAEAGRFHVTSHIDCVFELLRSAKPLKHRAPVHFHAGTAEVEAEIRRLKGTDPIAPGSREYVRLVLSEPLLLLPGDRFIVRMFSPVITIGGGVVLDIAPPRRATRLDRRCEFSKPLRSPNASRCWRANRATESECRSWWRAPACSKPIFESVVRCVAHRARIPAVLAARSRMGRRPSWKRCTSI